MDLTKKTSSTRPDYPIAGTTGIITAAKRVAAALKRGAPVVLDNSGKLAAVTMSGSTGDYKTKVTGLYGILTEDVKGGEQSVVYLSGESFANTLVLLTNGSATDLEVPFRTLDIFLK